MTSPLPLLILGDGTFAMDVADLIDDIPHLMVRGFVRSVPPFAPGAMLLDRPIYRLDELPDLEPGFSAVCALVTTQRCHFVKAVEALGVPFVSVIHPSARVSRRATVGRGVVVNGGVQVATHSNIGDHVILNRGALIGHHNTIRPFATISPGANLAGNVTVGERAWVGLGANVLEGLSIGEGAIVGAGALVTRDVASRTKVMGVPARVVAEDVDSH